MPRSHINLTRTLTDGQMEVFRLIRRGWGNQRIADELTRATGRPVPVDTVKSRVKAILGKLGAADRAHAVDLGWRIGLFQADDDPVLVAAAERRRHIDATANPHPDMLAGDALRRGA